MDGKCSLQGGLKRTAYRVRKVFEIFFVLRPEKVYDIFSLLANYLFMSPTSKDVSKGEESFECQDSPIPCQNVGVKWRKKNYLICLQPIQRTFTWDRLPIDTRDNRRFYPWCTPNTTVTYWRQILELNKYVCNTFINRNYRKKKISKYSLHRCNSSSGGRDTLTHFLGFRSSRVLRKTKYKR